jgi:mRNA interferase MazF
VVIVSADAYNRSRIRTVTTVAITSRVRLADARGNVLLASGEGGLPRASVVNVSQLATLDREDLIKRAGRLDVEAMLAVDAGLSVALAL